MVERCFRDAVSFRYDLDSYYESRSRAKIITRAETLTTATTALVAIFYSYAASDNKIHNI